MWRIIFRFRRFPTLMAAKIGKVANHGWSATPTLCWRSSREAGVKGTFFTLGWIAERHPQVVRAIVAGGHEIASHGYCHIRVDSQTPKDFRADIRRTKKILEDIGGKVVKGYRAATFSVGDSTPWAWPVLEEEGYRYSSSIYPVKRDNYANPNAPRTVYRPTGTRDLVEIPIATVRIGAKNYPAGGGGYFRFLPYWASRAAIARINRRDHAPAVFYLASLGSRSWSAACRRRLRQVALPALSQSRQNRRAPAPAHPRLPLGPHGFDLPRRILGAGADPDPQCCCLTPMRLRPNGMPSSSPSRNPVSFSFPAGAKWWRAPSAMPARI